MEQKIGNYKSWQVFIIFNDLYFININVYNTTIIYCYYLK